MRIAWALLFAIGVSVSVSSQGVEALRVTFVVNDAFVKDRFLEGVAVTVTTEGEQGVVFAGVTGSSGEVEAFLAAATYRVSYALEGYVPIGSSETSVHTDGQVITTAMSMLLEAEGSGAERRVRIILNWGSEEEQVRDADSHVLCQCRQGEAHVYYVEKNHARDGHTADLDVDDTDWGGPETITIADPPPGEYLYWVHDYSGPPALLGESDVVVRVLFGDTVAGEFHTPSHVVSRTWRPFKALVVEPDLRPRIVRFSEDELASGANLELPVESGVYVEDDDVGEGCIVFLVVVFLTFMVGVAGVATYFARRQRRS